MWFNVVTSGLKLGAKIYQNRRESKMLESQAQRLHYEKMAKGEIEYKQAVIKDNQQGLKDEFVLLLVSAPVMLLIWSIFSDDPDIMVKVDLFFEKLIIGSVLPLTTDLSITTDSTFSISGSSNMVFNNIDSKIDLSPLAPVFLFMALLAISVNASSLNSNLTFSNSKSLLYCLIKEFFGSFKIVIKDFSSKS